MRRALSRSGFGLLELLITTALVMLALLLAGRLLLESQVESSRRARELANVQPRFALARLRQDLEGARVVSGTWADWQEGKLEAVYADGRRVVWELEGSRLSRVEASGGGDVEPVRQVLLEQVSGWYWRRAGAGLLDVHLQVRRVQARGPVALSARRTWAASPRDEDVWLRVATRVAGAS